ncbi:hypothetical protein HYU07_01005 [Candidatus Woesearchaeota archaeon]|nr:hypothetical protein [Candidatus Woesearchaeota archaeon]
MGRNIKAQVSVEFIVFVGIGFIMLLIFLASSIEKMKEFNTEKEFILLKDVAYKVQNEIVLASIVNDGYMRTFDIPERLETSDYNISITGRTLIAQSDNYDYVLQLPDANGTLAKGNNTIKKTGGIVQIN